MTDPTGLRYDRADTEDTTPTPLPAGVEGFPLTGLRVKDCGCGVLANEECDCAEFAAGLEVAPVVVMPPFDLRALREAGITAAAVDRMCPPQRWQVTAEGVSVHLGAS